MNPERQRQHEHARAVRQRIDHAPPVVLRLVKPAPIVEPIAAAAPRIVSTGPNNDAHLFAYFHHLWSSYDNEMPAVSSIIHAVCSVGPFTQAQIVSARRQKSLVLLRQIGMHLSRVLTDRSTSEIGRKFGRDHTTAIHAWRKIERLKEEPDVAAKIAAVKAAIGFFEMRRRAGLCGDRA